MMAANAIFYELSENKLWILVSVELKKLKIRCYFTSYYVDNKTPKFKHSTWFLAGLTKFSKTTQLC